MPIDPQTYRPAPFYQTLGEEFADAVLGLNAMLDGAA